MNKHMQQREQERGGDYQWTDGFQQIYESQKMERYVWPHTVYTLLGYMSEKFSLRSTGSMYMNGPCTRTQWPLRQWEAGRTLGKDN